MDSRGYQCLNTMFMINVRNDYLNPLFLLGILNSSVVKAFWIEHFNDRRRTFPKIKGTYLKRVPICSVSSLEGAHDGSQAQLATLVERMISFQVEAVESKTSHDRTILQRQIVAMDRQIDRLVYELYGLTDEEIAVVERTN